MSHGTAVPGQEEQKILGAGLKLLFPIRLSCQTFPWETGACAKHP